MSCVPPSITPKQTTTDRDRLRSVYVDTEIPRWRCIISAEGRKAFNPIAGDSAEYRRCKDCGRDDPPRWYAGPLCPSCYRTEWRKKKRRDVA